MISKNKMSDIMRMLLSVILIISSILKLISLNSFTNTVRMFVEAYFSSFDNGTLIVLSFCICFYEIIIGVIGLIDRLKMLSLALLFITFFGFTLVTGINLFYPSSLGPIRDCNCFGNFLSLSPIGTFVKSVILLFLSLFSIVMAKRVFIMNRVPVYALMCTMMLGFTTDAKAQGSKSEVRIGGNVFDSFTNVGLPAFVTLLNKDSVEIDTTTCEVYRGNSWYTFYMPKIAGEYMVRVEHPGYETTVQRHFFDFAVLAPGYGFPTIKLKRLANAEDSIRSIGLDEVVIRGTRLQIAYRGDTIVYDAQAFNIPEGAMLDALVRQLPGAEMKANGDIYINGKRLDYITLNGNDFFKGNNKVILENLPYFVVKELQVYHKDPPFALTKPLTDDGKDYVLDVVMKREYAIGSIINTEFGMGTDDRWKTKTFGLRYDDYLRLAVFANLNNVNENRTPGSDGDWSPQKQPRGVLAIKQAGMNLNLNNANKTVGVDQSVIAEWSDNVTSLRQQSESFTSHGSIFNGKLETNRLKDFNLTDDTKLNVRFSKSLISSNLHLVYSSGKGNNFSEDSTYSSKLINTDRYVSRSGSRRLFGNGYLGWKFNFNSPYSMSVSVNYSFSNQWRDQFHVLHNIQYMNTGAKDGRNDYRDNIMRSYRYSLGTEHCYVLSPRITLSYRVAYEQNGSDRDNDYFRLYKYGGPYSEELCLPSSVDSLQAAMDYTNSYNYFEIGRGVSNDIAISYSWKNTSVFVSARHTYIHERIRYNNAGIDTVAYRNYGKWNLNLSLRHRWGRKSMEFRYYSTDNYPVFSMLMPLSDNTNTLNKRLNNPNLKSQLRNTIEMKLSLKPKGMKPTWWIKYNFTSLNRAWGNRVNYDTSTGAYTSIVDNVNGNWNTTLSCGMNGPIGKRKYWRYDISTEMGYIHSVDYNIAYNEVVNELSRVNTFKPKLSIKLNYRKSVFSAGLTAKLSGNFSHEEEYGQRDINVHEYQIGTHAQYTVPTVKLTIGTDINLYSQHGYRNMAMNTNDWLWNAFLSRPLFKGKMVAKVEFYDILRQLSVRSYSVNAQGWVETHYNSIPHYVMFSIGYKFTKTPKK